MNKIILTINGMKCGMCEAHVNDLFRKEFNLKKVTSSHTKNETIIITEETITDEALKKALDGSGYIIEGILRQEAKKTILGWK